MFSLTVLSPSSGTHYLDVGGWSTAITPAPTSSLPDPEVSMARAPLPFPPVETSRRMPPLEAAWRGATRRRHETLITACLKTIPTAAPPEV